MSFATALRGPVLACALTSLAAPAGAAVFDFSSGVTGGPVGVTRIESGGNAFLLGSSGVTGGTGEVSLFDPDDPAHVAADPDMTPDGEDTNPYINPAYLGVRETGPLIGFDYGSPKSLLLQEDNGVPGIPDDTGGGGTMVFTLEAGSKPVRLTSLSFIDDVDAIVSVDGLGIIGEIDIGRFSGPCGDEPANGDNCVAGLDFRGGNALVTSGFRVQFSGSGGVLGFEVETVATPVPAGLPLLLTGLGLMGWLGARKRSA